jgi:LAO/AO transport system kinase
MIFRLTRLGMMEIADIFVVNKAGREGADMVVYELESMLGFTGICGWKPPVVRTIATESAGISELACWIDEHFNYLKENDLIRQRLKRRAEMEILNIASKLFL